MEGRTRFPVLAPASSWLGWIWALIQKIRVAKEPAAPAIAFSESFLTGANLPWFSYGNDFGCNAWSPQGGISAPGRLEHLERTFAELAHGGIHCLRWFLFADGRSGILTNSAGQPMGLDERVFPDFALALDVAGRAGIGIMPVCFDFLLCAKEEHVNGVQLGGRGGWLTSQEGWTTLEQKVLAPLFQRFGKHPAILAWDLFNEPEWVVAGMGADGGATVFRMAKQAGSAVVFPWVMRARLASMARLAHDLGNRPVTVGLNSTRGLALVRGIGLDFFQVHWYDPHEAHSPLDSPVHALRLDRPLLLGEFPTRNSRLGQAEIIALAERNGYCGALAWSFLAEDAYSGMKKSDQTTHRLS